ncbi:hypothetical protein [Brevibacterium album]|uniref:arsenate reductase/protein-tyrosine-phosphatase family protein n=1 Tax=Brevibacterium album TaxID=417948 RepID=UPI0009FFAD62|nr:hypothetical protein [Brevibacterium album]
MRTPNSSSRRTDDFVLLLLCTGNICRSPLAALLLRRGLGDLPVRVRSAGTAAHDGSPMTEPAQRTAEALGLRTAREHRARQLTLTDLLEADLVLGLAREHRREAAELLPSASRRIFTLREFARLSAAQEAPAAVTGPEVADPRLHAVAGLRLGVESVARTRGTLPPPADPAEADVLDPYRGGASAYERSARQIVPAVEAVAELLRRSAAGRTEQLWAGLS